jgi:hypothetical protein
MRRASMSLAVTVAAAVAAAPAAGAPPLLPRRPYLGVACPKANSIRCDRVGVAVWLSRRAVTVVATVDGRRVRLRRAWKDRGTRVWTGFLRPAGLLGRGPLHVTPDRGRFFWEGRHPTMARVAVRVRTPGGAVRVRSLRVPLMPGWG